MLKGIGLTLLIFCTFAKAADFLTAEERKLVMGAASRITLLENGRHSYAVEIQNVQCTENEQNCRFLFTLDGNNAISASEVGSWRVRLVRQTVECTLPRIASVDELLSSKIPNDPLLLQSVRDRLEGCLRDVIRGLERI